ncbi:hypothetical protein F7725_027266 [Dissostichus mawsoni]|uniref:Uncharacterized protein n=1 Tax=Dissostichus mawsoni TaxID=36200 RepID=A0A7J5XEG7_DISMA|nr:hypothetical protein F7725_027266 [Dissostichus mawsoni]
MKCPKGTRQPRHKSAIPSLHKTASPNLRQADRPQTGSLGTTWETGSKRKRDTSAEILVFLEKSEESEEKGERLLQESNQHFQDVCGQMLPLMGRVVSLMEERDRP